MDDPALKHLGQQAAYLSLVETGVGSVLHGFKIPLSGQILSLNQIAFMGRLSHKLNMKDAAIKISIVASLLKSLSPAGKKLTPMLAILAQGLLFSSALAIFGVNIFGFLVASFLSSLWAFIQPVLFIYLLFGKTSLDVAAHFATELQKIINFDLRLLLPLAIAFVLLKVLAGIFICFFAIKMNDQDYAIFQNKMIRNIRLKPANEGKSALWLALKDLCSPLFILSFMITALFFAYSQSENTTVIWGLLRPLATGFILFYLIRVYPAEKIALFFEKMGFSQTALHLKEAIAIIRGQRGQ